MHFGVWKWLNCYWNFTEVYFQGSNWPYSSFGSDNGLVPTRWQTIIWTNDGKITDTYASLGLSELMQKRRDSFANVTHMCYLCLFAFRHPYNHSTYQDIFSNVVGSLCLLYVAVGHLTALWRKTQRTSETSLHLGPIFTRASESFYRINSQSRDAIQAYTSVTIHHCDVGGGLVFQVAGIVPFSQFLLFTGPWIT